MKMDYFDLDSLRKKHPAWLLLRSEHAPLIICFLHRVFIAQSKRTVSQSDMEETLEDLLFELRNQLGQQEAFPRHAIDYLNEWVSDEKGWLRKFYPQGSDEPHFDIPPATEKAILWIETLSERPFVGTESRLRTLFALVKQMSEGSETDPQARLAELQKRRNEIDMEMARIEEGDISTLSDTAIKDHFQQFISMSRELLSDFREVEQNFRRLDRRARERIALWDGGKGVLLEEIIGERDAIANSDQGKSFRAFWDFLMSGSRQMELTQLIEKILSLPPIAETKPDARIRRVHYDWLDAADHTQRTVALLSQQLRRFLDDQARLESRRIMDILHSIEAKALDLRESPPLGEFFQIDDAGADIELPMERTLYTPPIKLLIEDVVFESSNEDVDITPLFSHVVIDKPALVRHVRNTLQERTEITLAEIIEGRPLQYGLAELVVYLMLESNTFKTIVDEEITDIISWKTTCRNGSRLRHARLQRVTFVRQ